MTIDELFIESLKHPETVGVIGIFLLLTIFVIRFANNAVRGNNKEMLGIIQIASTALNNIHAALSVLPDLKDIIKNNTDVLQQAVTVSGNVEKGLEIVRGIMSTSLENIFKELDELRQLISTTAGDNKQEHAAIVTKLADIVTLLEKQHGTKHPTDTDTPGSGGSNPGD